MMSRPLSKILILSAVTLVSLFSHASAFDPSGLLEIHYINVGWGQSILVIGPDGTRMLIDGGRNGKGTSEVIPYMQSIGLLPTDELHYMIASHLHSDHIGGLDEVITGGYDVLTEVYDNGSDYSNSYVTAYRNATATTTAGPSHPIAIGTVIQLGDGATATCVCANGTVIGHGVVPGAINEENDRSMGLLIKYGDFEYLTAGDLGGGEADGACTGRNTNQTNVETHVAQAIIPGGEFPLLGANGLEVIHVNHHGSESSMNSDYMNLLTPAVACLSTGAGQSPDYMYPRHDIVDNVLLSGVYCISADAAIVLQNEEGQPAGNLTSYSGYCVGDIIVKTSGIATFIIDGSGGITEGPDERAALGMPLTLPLDEGGPVDSLPPFVQVNVPNGGDIWPMGSYQTIRWLATDDYGVAQYAIDYSINNGADWNVIRSYTNGNPGLYTWLVPTTASDSCLVKISARDAAGNIGDDISNGIFQIAVVSDTGNPTVAVLYPNGGEVLMSGDIDTIRWLANDDVGIGSYSISYSTNNGGTWLTVQTRTSGNPQVYPWNVPSTYSTNCKVRILVWDAAERLASDISDDRFTIRFPDHDGPNVQLVSPNGNESWLYGSNYNITWNASDTSGIDSVSIFYSIDEGLSWDLVAGPIVGNPGNYLWSLPDTPSRLAMVQVRAWDMVGNLGLDDSNGSFYLRKSPISVKENYVTILAR